MTWIAATDPLALVAIQAGQINAPSANRAAEGSSELDKQQRYIQIPEPVPIVFARFRNGKGGILVSPGATEARFENNVNNDVTAYYHLVISEGQIDGIPVKDVFQRSCRVGSHTQTYNRRAGTWEPGNVLVQRGGKQLPEAPYYCGTIGAYTGMSTLSFNVTIPDGFDQYNRQVHLFIRGGMHVERLYDSVTGPSDNLADLAHWLLLYTARIPSALIDTTALTEAATFLEINGFTCNCWIQESSNYGDLMAKWAPYFLLCESNSNGKKGLRPVLPTTAAGAIDTGTIVPAYLFNEAMIMPGTLEIEYLSYADRQPFVAQTVWRQQIESGIGIIRTAEVRYSGTAVAGPYETHDLSAFCTSENHAVKVGAYILAKRYYTTHTIRFSARPEAHNQILTPGDIIRVQLQRDATNYAPTEHNYLYQVERVTKTLAGEVSYEAVHFPVDSSGRSLVALDVVAAAGTGIVLPDNRTGVTCDINSPLDNTLPLEVFTELGYNTPDGENPGFDWPNVGDFEFPTTPADPTNPSGLGPTEIPPNTAGTGGGGGAQPQDGLSGGGGIAVSGTRPGGVSGGDTLTVETPPICEGYTLEFWASNGVDEPVLLQGGGQAYYTLTDNDVGLPVLHYGNPEITIIGRCPDGTSQSSSPIGVNPTPVYYFSGFVTPTNRYRSAVFSDLDSVACPPNGTITISAAGSGTGAGIVQTVSGDYALQYSVGQTINISVFISGMPIVVNDTLRHIAGFSPCGNPTGILVKLTLSDQYI